MGEFITKIIVGLILIVIGIMNIKGNISLLHSYHKKRVKEEDVKPFGKKLGIGSIIVGITIILSTLFEILNYTKLSDIVMILGLITGCGLIFYALFKYNKGIF